MILKDFIEKAEVVYYKRKDYEWKMIKVGEFTYTIEAFIKHLKELVK